MSALIYISKDLNQMSRRAKSCARCSSHSDSRQPSPGRGAYLPSEKGRNLSLEIDGRHSRSGRRSASSGREEHRQSRKAAHCYVVPYANGNPPVTSPTTYRDDFRSPIGQTQYVNGRTVSPFPNSRSNINFRSSPSNSTSLNLSSSKSFHAMSRSSTPLSQQPPPPPQQQQRYPRSAMTRSVTVDNNFGRTKTTYMDHFSWNGQ